MRPPWALGWAPNRAVGPIDVLLCLAIVQSYLNLGIGSPRGGAWAIGGGWALNGGGGWIPLTQESWVWRTPGATLPPRGSLSCFPTSILRQTNKYRYQDSNQYASNMQSTCRQGSRFPIPKSHNHQYFICKLTNEMPPQPHGITNTLNFSNSGAFLDPKGTPPPGLRESSPASSWEPASCLFPQHRDPPPPPTSLR